MKCEAVLTTMSRDATVISASLNVDNLHLDGLSVSTKCERDVIISKISAESVSSVLACADDLIRCQCTSEDLI